MRATPGDRSVSVDTRHMADTHWAEQRSEDQFDFLNED